MPVHTTLQVNMRRNSVGVAMERLTVDVGRVRQGSLDAGSPVIRARGSSSNISLSPTSTKGIKSETTVPVAAVANPDELEIESLGEVRLKVRPVGSWVAYALVLKLTDTVPSPGIVFAKLTALVSTYISH